MASYDVEVQWDDQRTYRLSPVVAGASAIELRDYQEPMCAALIAGEQGIGEAATGAGKTAVTLEAIRRVGQEAIVIVEKSSLAKQWMDAAQSFLGIDVGYIGEGGMRLGPITIALRPALWAKREELWQASLFDRFGVMVLDECHHLPKAETVIDIVQRFTARYRWGVSATPDRDPGYFPILQAIIGPVLWETTMADAGEHLMIPTVSVLESSFEFPDYHPTQRLQDVRTGVFFTLRNNYNEMMSALCSDSDRNQMIADRARQEADSGHHVLIVSKRKQHLRAIHSLIEPRDGLFMLIGGQKGEEALRIRGQISSATNGTILLSTVAEEGLDVPKLDRVIPAYPSRNVETMRQIVGRVMRRSPGKTDAVVIDIRDGHQDLLRSQFSGRAQQLFGKEGWTITR